MIKVFDATISPELMHSRRNRREMLGNGAKRDFKNE